MTNAQPSVLHPNVINMLRLLGYGLLMYAAVDALVILYPPKFTDPEWEMQLIGNLVERAPVPLIGFAFVFLGSQTYQRWSLIERLWVKVSTFLCLLLAMVFLLLVPLGIFDTKRVIDLNEERTAERVEETSTQLNQLTESLEQIDPNAIARLQAQLAEAEAQGQQARINNRQIAGLLQLAQGIPFAADPAAAKEQLLERGREQVANQKAQIDRQASAEKKRFKKALFENSAKWVFSSFLTSALFFMLYLQTGWLRKLPLKKKKTPPSGIRPIA
ncbi:MAG: HpsJ family protein [Cyanobacteria bacterium J06641_5]